MKNLRALSDESLLQETQVLVAEERRVSLAVLHHLQEIDRRRLFAGLGFSSLYEYATRALGYSEASAQRRIQAARLLSQCPELAPQIESGSLSLSVLSQAQTFFRREEIRDPKAKREILKTLENQSTRQAERKLLSLASEPALHLPEKVRSVSETHSEIRFTADSELLAQIEELKALLGVTSLQEALAFAVQAGLDRKKPKAVKTPLPQASASESPTPAPVARTRSISAESKRVVWGRDQGQCSFLETQSGRRCSSKFGLQLDHLKPYALGGSNHPDNLALKCRAHNQFAAIQEFGRDKMAKFVKSLR